MQGSSHSSRDASRPSHPPLFLSWERVALGGDGALAWCAAVPLPHLQQVPGMGPLSALRWAAGLAVVVAVLGVLPAQYVGPAAALHATVARPRVTLPRE